MRLGSQVNGTTTPAQLTARTHGTAVIKLGSGQRHKSHNARHMEVWYLGSLACAVVTFDVEGSEELLGCQRLSHPKFLFLVGRRLFIVSENIVIKLAE